MPIISFLSSSFLLSLTPSFADGAGAVHSLIMKYWAHIEVLVETHWYPLLSCFWWWNECIAERSEGSVSVTQSRPTEDNVCSYLLQHLDRRWWTFCWWYLAPLWCFHYPCFISGRSLLFLIEIFSKKTNKQTNTNIQTNKPCQRMFCILQTNINSYTEKDLSEWSAAVTSLEMMTAELQVLVKLYCIRTIWETFCHWNL